MAVQVSALPQIIQHQEVVAVTQLTEGASSVEERPCTVLSSCASAACQSGTFDIPVRQLQWLHTSDIMAMVASLPAVQHWPARQTMTGFPTMPGFLVLTHSDF